MRSQPHALHEPDEEVRERRLGPHVLALGNLRDEGHLGVEEQGQMPHLKWKRKSLLGASIYDVRTGGGLTNSPFLPLNSTG